MYQHSSGNITRLIAVGQCCLICSQHIRSQGMMLSKVQAMGATRITSPQPFLKSTESSGVPV